MNDPERPPLDPVAEEKIDQRLYEIDQEYWPLIRGFLVPVYIPSGKPCRPGVLSIFSIVCCAVRVLCMRQNFRATNTSGVRIMRRGSVPHLGTTRRDPPELRELRQES
jgi:hypothetical protein